jgi:UDPglucose--hexose-1-phosphate uridylyltransferase
MNRLASAASRSREMQGPMASDGMAAWEQRWHPLREEWVVVAAHRQNRPWHGEQAPAPAVRVPAYVEDCYFCPRNVRVSGARNPDYRSVFVFDNDHPCVGDEAPRDLEPPPGIYRNAPAAGVARVVCYTPRHDLTLAELPAGDIAALLGVWRDQYLELGSMPGIRHVLTFENKGEVVGVSNPHPHGQIYATTFVFKTIETEAAAARRYYREHRRVLFQDILRSEQADGRRILFESASAVVFLPYFARYAYECYVAPKETHASLATMSAGEMGDLATALKALLVRYDNLWQMSFPYVLTLHQAPTDGADHTGFHFHLECHPPLRKPHLLKYLAGPEIGGGNFLSDTRPEVKAAELRALPEVHYRLRQDVPDRDRTPAGAAPDGDPHA